MKKVYENPILEKMHLYPKGKIAADIEVEGGMSGILDEELGNTGDMD